MDPAPPAGRAAGAVHPVPAPGRAAGAVFRFAQVEVPWPLGPPDGRYVLRPDGRPDAPIADVIVIATLGAPQRRRLGGRRPRESSPEPAPTPVATGRATVIEAEPHAPERAIAWLKDAGEDQLATALRTLNRGLRGFRLVTADPYAMPLRRDALIAARVGYGTGEQVAGGRWERALELPAPRGRRRRSEVLEPQGRLAAVLGGRRPPLVCEELVLRARLDLDQGHPREAALQLLPALDAAIAELSAGAVQASASGLEQRLGQLRERRAGVADAARAALAGTPSEAQQELVAATVERLQAALRARAAGLD